MDSLSTLKSAPKNALTLTWAFGFNKDIVDGVHSLYADDRQALFYVAAHTGVIYDYAKRTQELLQGHCNPICAVAVSHNKKWVATADAGQDSMLVVWDTASGTPIKSIFNPHSNGVVAMDISADALFIVTLSDPGQSGRNSEDTEPQTISVWEWTHPSRKEALFTSAIDEPDIQKVVKFNQSDVRHLITTGEHKTMFWGWEHGGLRGYIPKISRHDFKKGNGVYTSCCFLPGTSQAITATSVGEVVLWDQVHTPKGMNGDGGVADNDVVAEAAQLFCNKPKRQAVKVLKLCDGAITHVSTVCDTCWPAGGEEETSATGAPDLGSAGEGSGGGTKPYVVVASEDGAVRFYDLKFRVEAWFEDLGAGGVTSVSFAAKLPLRPEGDTEPTFRVPDFVVGTNRAYAVACEASAFEELDPERRRGSVLLQGMVGSVTCVAAHPLLPRLVVLCDSGDIHLWDYNLKALVIMRSFDAARLRPQCCAFHPQGTLLAVGFSSGACKILDSSDLEEVASFRYTPAPLSSIRFSPDGETVAACDTDNHVLLFKHSMVEAQPQADTEESSSGRTPQDEEAQLRDTWTYVGRHRSHGRSITGLEFGTREDGRVSLVSVGEDRSLVEYNLLDSNQETGLLMAEAPRRIEQSGLPTALMWHPLLGSDFEDRLVTANSEYKLKQWNADNKSCRRTTLGPTFGGPINRLEQINHIHTDGQSRPSEFVAYGTADKVVGLVQMPFDGDSHKMMGLIAHPGEITSLSVSGDGNHLATAGGKDLTVNLWKINAQAMQKNTTSNASAGNDLQTEGGAESELETSGTEGPSLADDMAPFLEQLQGGKGGELHEELMEYFFYALLRTQGEDTTSERSTSNVVPIAEVPNIMRALGYYPTEQEVAHMSNEIKYSRFTETGEVEDSVDLNGVIRLFVNHRPVFPVNKQVIHEAFTSMGGDTNDGVRMAWSSICAKLQSCGERISEEELAHCLEALTGDTSSTRINGRQSLFPAQFAEEVLGFEDHRQAHSSAIHMSDGDSLAPTRLSRGG